MYCISIGLDIAFVVVIGVSTRAKILAGGTAFPSQFDVWTTLLARGVVSMIRAKNRGMHPKLGDANLPSAQLSRLRRALLSIDTYVWQECRSCKSIVLILEPTNAAGQCERGQGNASIVVKKRK